MIFIYDNHVNYANMWDMLKTQVYNWQKYGFPDKCYIVC